MGCGLSTGRAGHEASAHVAPNEAYELQTRRGGSVTAEQFRSAVAAPRTATARRGRSSLAAPTTTTVQRGDPPVDVLQTSPFPNLREAAVHALDVAREPSAVDGAEYGGLLFRNGVHNER